MTQFKVNDKVICIREYDEKKPTGVGTVRDVSLSFVRVNFPDWKGGHNGGGFCENRHGWNFRVDEANDYLKIYTPYKTKKINNFEIIYDDKMVYLKDKMNVIEISKKDLERIFKKL